jgi:predicted RNA-binding Zn-ribbon protein involved in translation (DUF1610 family)
MFIWLSLKKKKVFFKCPKCGNVIESAEKERDVCQDCGVRYELLEGYFNRHPEKK